MPKKAKIIVSSPQITIPLSENDLDDIRNGEVFDWTFTTNTGLEINTIIRLETEKDLED